MSEAEICATGGLFCTTAQHLNWANAIYGGHGSDTVWPLPSPGSSQYPASLIINARDRLARSVQDPVRILVTGRVGEHVLLGGTRVSTFLCYIRNTAPAAILGLPSVTIPAGTTASGLPVGLQFDGHPHADTELLRLALHCSGCSARRGPSSATDPPRGNADASPRGRPAGMSGIRRKRGR